MPNSWVQLSNWADEERAVDELIRDEELAELDKAVLLMIVLERLDDDNSFCELWALTDSSCRQETSPSAQNASREDGAFIRSFFCDAERLFSNLLTYYGEHVVWDVGEARHPKTLNLLGSGWLGRQLPIPNIFRKCLCYRRVQNKDCHMNRSSWSTVLPNLLSN